MLRVIVGPTVGQGTVELWDRGTVHGTVGPWDRGTVEDRLYKGLGSG